MGHLQIDNVIQIIVKWKSRNFDSDGLVQRFNLQDTQNGTHLITKITLLFLNNIHLILFTPDFMAWVIECLLIGEFDSTNASNSD